MDRERESVTLLHLRTIRVAPTPAFIVDLFYFPLLPVNIIYRSVTAHNQFYRRIFQMKIATVF